MLNGTAEINLSELAKLARKAREAKGLTQGGVATEIGSSQKWVSMIEMQQIQSFHPESLDRIEKMAIVLDFDVPYVGQAPKAAEETRKTLSLPAKVEPTPVPTLQRAPDAEIEAIRICSEAMEKIGDREACQRVLGYVRNRYGLPKPPFDGERR